MFLDLATGNGRSSQTLSQRTEQGDDYGTDVATRVGDATALDKETGTGAGDRRGPVTSRWLPPETGTAALPARS